MSPLQIAQARTMIEAGGHTKQQIAETFKVSRTTLTETWQLQRTRCIPSHNCRLNALTLTASRFTAGP